jgi:YhcH/YjgK/YiaL family protein
MIIDQLTNLEQYRGLPSRLVRALEFLRDTDVLSLALGRHDLDGDRLFALVQEYPTKPVAECRWEAHRRYCDVQFVARGVERIGVVNIERMRVDQPYDSDRDVAFFAGEGDFITLHAGAFAIFAPQDVHMPCLTVGESQPIRKIVLKAELGNA